MRRARGSGRLSGVLRAAAATSAVGAALAAGTASCGVSDYAADLRMGPDAPTRADAPAWNQALGILRDAAFGPGAGPGAYGPDEADAALETLRIFRDLETVRAVATDRGDAYRATAAAAEWALADPEGVDAALVLAGARDASEDVRARACEGLGTLTRAAPEMGTHLEALARDPSPAVRRAALAAMPRPGGVAMGPRGPVAPSAAEVAASRVVAVAVARLADEDAGVRGTAAFALSWLADGAPPPGGAAPEAHSTAPGAWPAWIALLDDPSDGVRAVVHRALARSKRGRLWLTPRLAGEDSAGRVRAAALLAAFAGSGAEARAVLESALGSAEAEERRRAADALYGAASTFEHTAAQAVAMAALPLLADADAWVRLQAGRVLLGWRLPDFRESALLALRPLAERGPDAVALGAAQALAGADDPAGDRALARLLRGAAETPVRAMAATHLSRVTGDHVLPLLLAALDDPAPRVRVSAAAGLLRALRR